MDKNQAVIDFLSTCPTIQENPLFFNFGDIRDNAHQAITKSDDVSLHKPYIDGSVMRRYTCSIDSFKSVAYNPIVEGHTDENLSEFKEVQDILEWINEQGDVRNFPDFGEGYLIDAMKTLTTKPDLIGVNTSLNPPVAVYRISIQIDYIDQTKMIWK